MNKMRWTALLLALVMAFGLLAGCAAKPETATTPEAPVAEPETPASPAPEATEPAAPAAPKYVFLFIGDGMSYPQVQTASDYLGAVREAEENDGILDGGVPLSFMEFPVAGSATTFDSTSFDPDSASTATSISTGHKTHSGVINMDESKTTPYTAISEQLRDAGLKIGVISTVNLNHATPAAFYAHQPSRGNYYEIGVEMANSDFDYFAGGALLSPTGKEEDQADIYQVLTDAGYQVAKTTAEAEALTDGKMVLIAEQLADADAMDYDLDRLDGEWALKDYVKKGIEVLDGDDGFFMMVEGGKIDWAGHANDAGSVVTDVLALDEAVKEAIAFAETHPEETLILVTGDHETGGLSIGFAGTDYSTYLDNLTGQKISYAQFDELYVSKYVAEKASFETAMADVTALFGLVLPADAAKATSETLVLTDYELERLKTSYELTVNGYEKDAEGNDVQSQQQYVDYGTYTPFSVTVTHLLNNKSGLDFTSYSHTGIPVPVFASGNGEALFEGYYDNTDIYHKLAGLLGIA